MQTSVDVPHAELFPADYPYYSGSSRHWRKHCRDFAAFATRHFKLGPLSSIIEVGGNDGTMLENFVDCEMLNVEPSERVARTAMGKNIPTFVGRFQEVYTKPADLIIANNVMAHDPDLNGFAAAIKRNLAEGGTASIEFPWIKTLLENCEFDTIYHEHYSYLSLTALIPLFFKHGLAIYDVETLDTHGGSLRIWVGHRGYHRTDPFVWIKEQEECVAGVRNARTYEVFRERAFNTAGAFTKFVAQYPGQVYAAGAAAKAAVFANFCGLTSKDIVMFGDATPAKWDKLLPGSRIPITSEADMCARQPTFIWIAAWNWRAEISDKMRVMAPHAKFVIASPELEII